MTELPNVTEPWLGRAIAALKGEGFCPALIGWLSRCFEIDNTTIIAYGRDVPPRPLFAQSRRDHVHARLHSHYVAGAYRLDPFHALHRRHAEAGLYALRDIAPDHFLRNDYYASYYRATTLVDEIAFLAWASAGVSVHVCLGRDETSGRRFAARDLERATRIAPIVTALAATHWAGLELAGHEETTDLAPLLRRRLLDTRGIALTPRQAETAVMILRGHSTASMALTMGISVQTVKVFRKQLYRNCAISSQAELFTLVMPLLAQG